MAKGVLTVKVVGDTRKFEQSMDKLPGKLAKFAAAGVAAGAGIVGAVGVQAVQAFASFDKQMREVFTLLPGISQDAMKGMEKDVKSFASEFNVVPQEVVPALYQALSAGVPQKNVFTFLETAQKAAKGGVTDLTTAVDGISSVVNAYGEDVIDAAKASDLMFTTVKLGKTNFEELSGALFNVIPTAAAAGVSFDDVSAALATVTSLGTPTSVATTQIRAAIVEMSKAGSKTASLFEKLAGRTFRDFISSGGDLQGALQLLVTHADETNLSVSDLFGSVEAGNAVLTLTSAEGAQKFDDALGQMNTAAGATDAAYETMAGGLAESWASIKADVQNALLIIGEALEPFVERVSDAMGRVVEAFNTGGANAAFAQMRAEWEAAWPDIQAFLSDTALPAIVGWVTDLAIAVGKAAPAIGQALLRGILEPLGSMDVGRALQQAVNEATGGSAQIIGGEVVVNPTQGPALPPPPTGGAPRSGFAHGGTVPGPVGAGRMALVHGGETIIPAGRVLGGDGAVSITVNGFVGNERELADQIAEMLRRRERGLR